VFTVSPSYHLGLLRWQTNSAWRPRRTISPGQSHVIPHWIQSPGSLGIFPSNRSITWHGDVAIVSRKACEPRLRLLPRLA
jgi:hypothetical protein